MGVVMKKYNLKIVVISIIGIFSTMVSNSQGIITTSGGNHSGVNGKVCYTVGQVAYSTQTSVSEGIQQPYEIYKVTSVEEPKIDINMSVFPNPVETLLTLKIEDYPIAGLCYQISDLHGQIIEVKDIRSSETRINMQKNMKSVYFIKIYDQDSKKNIKSFKIIKK